METTLMGLYRDYRVYIGIMENKMETTIVYWGYVDECTNVQMYECNVPECTARKVSDI